MIFNCYHHNAHSHHHHHHNCSWILIIAETEQIERTIELIGHKVLLDVDRTSLCSGATTLIVIHSIGRFTEMEATDTSTNHKLTEDYRGEGGGMMMLRRRRRKY